MIRRLLWLGAGVAIGVMVVRTLVRAAESYSPGGLAATAQKSARAVADSVRQFVEDVREGMAEREEQIYAALAESAAFGDTDPENVRYLHDEPYTYHLEGDTDR